ncbi:2TM domain-containing protein [Olleya aquimaris]|uniref:2TM domain-containing protein n=1 Tax=Olleya aquimaris TaxID=639310 RepID=A0A327RIG9_9FLAO|nr:2TM domain-containing protein [Olleya aquimaris]RAJ16846.1 2TM domain-containing protein [Olleya aquimaris]
MDTTQTNQRRLERAKIRVKKIKGFYTHLLIYVVINLVIVYINIQNLEPGESYFQYRNFITLTLWGFALIIHALTTFLPNFILGVNWEQRQIEKFISKERDQKRWE